MAQRYFCPSCQGNRTHFYLIKKLAQEVRKDPNSGKIIWAAEEWEDVLEGRKLFMEVRCAVCGYVSNESIFTQAAKNLDSSQILERN